MTRFTAHNRSTATLAFSQVEIWKALTDPQLLPELTPYLRDVVVDGDRWRWEMARIPLMGSTIGTTFTEVMDLEEPGRIRFTHADDQPSETTWVDGEYVLAKDGESTRVTIDLGVTCELPLPRLARPAVQTGMAAVMAGIGRRFGQNLVRHLNSAR